MTSESPKVVFKRAEDVQYQQVHDLEGLRKGKLLSEADGTPNFSIRRFTIEPGTIVPKHTNAVEHEQFVLEGRYTIGIGETEYSVLPGDSILIPAGIPHWYRNETEQEGSFLCVVPNEPDELTMLEDDVGTPNS